LFFVPGAEMGLVMVSVDLSKWHLLLFSSEPTPFGLFEQDSAIKLKSATVADGLCTSLVIAKTACGSYAAPIGGGAL
jgi:hypothetical protein